MQKQTIFTNDKIVYIENPKESTTKTNKFSKIAGYKVNTQNSIIFLYDSNE